MSRSRDVGSALEPKTSRRGLTPNDDVVVTSDDGGRLLVLVADGATGVGDGWRASGMLDDLVRAAGAGDGSSARLRDLLVGADRRIAVACDGEADTTGVLLVVRDGRVVGASAGDSEAWLVTDASAVELTVGQARKPRIGSGARPVAFDVPFPPGATLVVATDGLWNAVSRSDAFKVAATAPSARDAATALARLATEHGDGELHDDVGIVVVRLRTGG